MWPKACTARKFGVLSVIDLSEADAGGQSGTLDGPAVQDSKILTRKAGS